MKVLALAPGRRLHREQVIDLVWPGDTIAEAVPKLHKAAHFARRAIGVPDSVVLRGDQVVLYPGGSVSYRSHHRWWGRCRPNRRVCDRQDKNGGGDSGQPRSSVAG